VGRWNTTVYPRLSDLQKTFNQEWRSTVGEADLSTEGGYDFHPKSVEVRWNEMGWVTDTVQSVCIDLGDLAAACTSEPSPNGGRVNVGNYGNTTEASKSRTNAWLRALTFNDGGSLTGAVNALYWIGGGFTNGATVRVEFSTDFGANWVTVQGGLTLANGVYVWDVSGLSPMSCNWRVVCEADTNVWDGSDQRVNVNGE
jgi:hypothetical protein